MSFSKKLVAWAMIVTTACIIASYVLSFMGLENCGEVTISVATTCIAIAVSYEVKSLEEKKSLNNNGLSIDEEGNISKIEG